MTSTTTAEKTPNEQEAELRERTRAILRLRWPDVRAAAVAHVRAAVLKVVVPEVLEPGSALPMMGTVETDPLCDWICDLVEAEIVARWRVVQSAIREHVEPIVRECLPSLLLGDANADSAALSKPASEAAAEESQHDRIATARPPQSERKRRPTDRPCRVPRCRDAHGGPRSRFLCAKHRVIDEEHVVRLGAPPLKRRRAHKSGDE